MRINGVLFSEGNRKLGGIPSVSFEPTMSCGRGLKGPLLCLKDCYAMKMKQYTSVEPGWKENFRIWEREPARFWDAVCKFLSKKEPQRFRWFVGGDIPSRDFTESMITAAQCYPNTLFRVFTKAQAFLPLTHPPVRNLCIGISRWPGMPLERRFTGYSFSWLRPKQGCPGYQIPKDARKCPGNCESCSLCWNMKAGESVVFDQH